MTLPPTHSASACAPPRAASTTQASRCACGIFRSPSCARALPRSFPGSVWDPGHLRTEPEAASVVPFECHPYARVAHPTRPTETPPTPAPVAQPLCVLEVVSQMACERGRATKAEGKERVRSGISRLRGELATQPSDFGAGRSGRGVVKPLLMLGLAPPFPHIEQLPVTIYKAVHGELRTPCLSALHLDSCQV